MLKILTALAIALAIAACGSDVDPVAAPNTDANASAAEAIAGGLPNDNPFAAPSSLYLEAPAFDKINNAHFVPAFEAGMSMQLAEVNVVVNNPEVPSFENTIVALERSGRLLDRASKVFSHLTNSNTDDELNKIESDFAPKFAAHNDAIVLNDALFGRIRALYDSRETLGLSNEQVSVLTQYYRDFARNGALLNAADKAKLRTLNEEQAALIAKFGENALNGTNAAAVVVDSVDELAGLSEADVSAAAEAAKARGIEGKWVIPLLNTTLQPALQSARNRGLRERLFMASSERGVQDNAYDNRPLILRLVALRAERAKLLGYAEHASYALEAQMAHTSEAALKILTHMAKPALAAAKRDAARLQKLIDAESAANHSPSFKLAPWDWPYYSEKLRQQEFDFDDAEIRPYFELDSVLQKGVFFAANKLYGITFKERKDLPVYHPDVRVFEVFEEDGTTLGLFYADLFARPAKRGGAWMNNLVDQSRLLGTRPVVANDLNIPKPAAGKPALLSFDEVNTLFHEFGHAMHGLFADAELPLLSGVSVPNDFGEFPSNFNENWVLEPAVLKNYAKHYQTGAILPDALIAKLKKAGTFNQGFATLEYVAASLLDMRWHALTTEQLPADVEAFEKAALIADGTAMEEILPRYRSGYFSHIFSNDYAAGYYSYLWCEVLDADAYDAFAATGGLTRENGEKFRRMLLSRGATEDVNDLYLHWRGNEPTVDALMRRRGFSEK